MIDSGRLFIIGVTLLISFLAYTSQIFVFWDFLGGLNIECLKILIPFNISVILIFWNYYLTCTTDPGRVPADWYPKENQENIELKRSTRAPRYCKTCSAYKPPRSHHCSTCRRCVLKMDHHCPWTNNCVGHYNYGHFIRFVFWVDVACTYHLILLIKRTAKMVQDISYYRYEPTTLEMIFIILNYAAVIPVLLSVGILSLYHFYCTLFNTTTIENWEKDKVSTMVRKGKIKQVIFPYDIGVYKNIRSVLGYNPLLWCLPQQMDGTGLSYPIAKDSDPTLIWPPKDPTLSLPSNSTKPWDKYNVSKDEYKLFVKNSLLDYESKRRRNSNSGRKSDSSDFIIQDDENYNYSRRKVRRDSEGYIVKDIAFEEKGYHYDGDKELNSDGSVIYPSSDEYSDNISDNDEYIDNNGHIDENYYIENFREKDNNDDHYLKNINNNYNRKQYQSKMYSNSGENEDDDNLPIGLMIAKKQLEAMNIKSNYQVDNNVVAYTINDSVVSDKKDN
ncbi:DHHC palmitoyltransferase-domain-containing protein [Rhizophagus diaphanus]|nr:DHHC palmitoyltransferase-domain-containing protein [Rhizophagus diaphanus] [Rhizophagus sp. MUCL 43196]